MLPLLREPLLWAAAAALVGAAVGLVGTFHLAAWVSDPNGTMRSSSRRTYQSLPSDAVPRRGLG